MKFESCVDDYSPAPDDFPVWCVEAEANWYTGLQLLGEILLLIVLVYLTHRFAKWWKTRRIQRRRQQEELNRKWP